MTDIREVIRRLIKGESARRIARELGISRNTVSGYRQWAAQRGLLSGPLADESELARRLAERGEVRVGAQELSKAAPHEDRIKELLRAGVEGKAIWQILQDDHGFVGSYSSVKRFVRKLMGQKPPRGVVRLEVSPGEEAQVDFGYAGRVFDPATGRERRAWVFVMVLSFSRHMYAQVAFDQSVATWTRLHTAAFEFFGGTPRRLIVDNLKSAIVRACFDDPEIQRSYRSLCEHYDVTVSPCRPRTPEHKGKVEKGGVHYVKRNGLAGRKFKDIYGVNSYLLKWCVEVAGLRVHGTTQQVPLELFESTEKAALQPLPPTRWERCEWKTCKLHPDCHVVFDKSYYSAPHRLIGRTLMVCATAKLVQIFHDHELVAVHSRASRAGQRVTLREHLPPEKVAWLMKTPSWCRARAREIGPSTSEFIEQLLADKPLDRLRGAQGVLRLADKHGPKRLEAACARALHYGEIRSRTVKSILLRSLDFELPFEEVAPVASVSKPRHARRWSEFFPDTDEQGGAACRSSTN